MNEIREATSHRRGVRMWYVESDSEPGTFWWVQHMRTRHMDRWTCNCPDYQIRQMPIRRHCKHIKRVRAMLRVRKAA